MCIWTIYSTMQYIGDTCAEVKKSPIRSAIAINVRRMESFIVRNSDIVPSELAGHRARFVRDGAQLCKPGGEGIRSFRQLEKDGVERMNANIDKLLEIDRPPAWNPCL